MPENTKNTRILNATRLFGLSFAGLIAVVGVTNLAPDLFTSSSRRAVVTAPVNLVTTPIDGRLVESQLLQPGAEFRRGDVVAIIENGSVDRTALIGLQSQVLALEERLNSASVSVRETQALISRLDADMSRMKSELVVQLRAGEGEARAKMGKASATLAERKGVLARFERLLKLGIVNEQYIEPLRQQLKGAEGDLAGAQIQLKRQEAARGAGEEGVYVIETSNIMAGLQQERRSAGAKLDQLSSEKTGIEARLGELRPLVALETKRIGALARSEVIADGDGQVLEIERWPGQHVSAGGTLLKTTDCDKAFVAAVFPDSRVANLPAGTLAKIDFLDAGTTYSGRITRIVSRATERDTERYWVSLPSAERNEVYVLMSLDNPREALPTSIDGSKCRFGDWVRVSLENPWAKTLSSTISGAEMAMSQGLAWISKQIAAFSTALAGSP